MEAPTRPVRFGVCYDFRNLSARRTNGEHYRHTLDRLIQADDLGFDHVWSAEHHMIPDGYCPSPATIAAALASRTNRIRIGVGLLLLPLHHPLEVAEQVAVIDLLSDGRAELAVGMGYRVEEFAGFGIEHKRRKSRMEEGCEIVLRAWTEDDWSFAGKNWNLQDVSVHPRPVQQPHPPLWISARNEVAARRAARFRCPLLIAPAPYTTDAAAVYASYAEGLRELGEDPNEYDVCGYFDCVVTDDPERYLAKTASLYATRRRELLEWYGKSGDIADDIERIGNPPPELDAQIGVVADAPGCTAAIERFVNSGVPYTDVIMGGATLEAFAAGVMPHFR
jgi:alkanesulfonate monooxygenase SsuD/methylene tetrahydromethanopterin reductase-like flavin-dependent oxidoreductase (luciferase family)